MRAAFGLALVVMLGCSHDAKPVAQPDEQPPLPPASGTPIGYLIDDATELKLSDDQLSRLKTIDAELSARLDVLDTELRSGHAAPAASTPAAGRHRGGRRGGMGGGSMGGGMAGGGMAGRGMGGRGMGGRGTGGSSAGAGAGSGSGGGTPSPGGASSAEAVNRATEERRADVRDALQRAFALFDPTQQQIARRVLADRGVDLDAGRSDPSPPEAEPTEPDTGGDGN